METGKFQDFHISKKLEIYEGKFQKPGILGILNFPDFLCDICTRQLELLVWQARPDSPTYSQDSQSSFIQLININK